MFGLVSVDSYRFGFGLGRFRLVSGLVRHSFVDIHELCTIVNDELVFVFSFS